VLARKTSFIEEGAMPVHPPIPPVASGLTVTIGSGAQATTVDVTDSGKGVKLSGLSLGPILGEMQPALTCISEDAQVLAAKFVGNVTFTNLQANQITGDAHFAGNAYVTGTLLNLA
jgi:hypothetical protein